MDLERYNNRRQEILKKHRKKLLGATLPVLAIAITIAIAAILILGSFAGGLPYMGVILVADLLISVIYLTMRIAILSHRRQKELLLFEEEELSSPFHKM